MKTLRILIILFHSSKNIGDRAILESTIERFRNHIEDPEFLVVANYPEEPFFNNRQISVEPSPWVLVGKTDDKSIFSQIWRFIFGIFWALISKLSLSTTKELPGYLPQKWHNLFQTYLNADIIVGSGGNQFYSSGRYGWPFPLNAMSVWLAHLFGKPLFTMPQSIGPLKRPWEKKLLAHLYRQNRMTFLRDNRSIQLAKKLDLVKNVSYAPDLAFRPSEVDSDKAKSFLNQWGFNKSDNNIGMTIIAPMGFALDKKQVENYYLTLKGLIEKMIRTIDCEVFLFRQVSGPTRLENDGIINEIIANKINSPEKKRVHVINQEFSPTLMMALYRQMDLFIASRLHSGIFALCGNVPTVFIGYLSKTMGVLEALGLDAWGKELSNINPENIWLLVNKAWDQKNRMRSDLKRLMPHVFEQADKVIIKVLIDYQNLLRNSKS